MPQALIDKINRSGKFNQGYITVEYLADAILDMEIHTRVDGDIGPTAFERDVLAKIGVPTEIALRHRLPHFSHLFASDAYSAGYYSYLWSDVMAADAWKAFTDAGGPWDKAVAARMREHILSDGNASDRAEAFRRFRGRDPDVKALFEDRGFPVPNDCAPGSRLEAQRQGSRLRARRSDRGWRPGVAAGRGRPSPVRRCPV
jgi:peptidyl-dipeptidase Dcp